MKRVQKGCGCCNLIEHHLWMRMLDANFTQQFIMKQKQAQLEVLKPPIIKLTPYKPLPRLRLFALNSPTNHPHLLPPIVSTSKAKTEPSEKHFSSNQCIKTQPSGAQCQTQSSSSRLITRFIYNHLQKKINFHLKTCKKYQDSMQLHDQTSASIDSDRPAYQQSFIIKHNKFDCHFPDSEPQIANHIRETSSSQILKLRNKLSIRAKAAQRNMSKENRGRNRNRYANIDSYFDLSCLDSFQYH